jgi:hypothetical protein
MKMVHLVIVVIYEMPFKSKQFVMLYILRP